MWLKSTFSTKQRCKAHEGEHGMFETEGPEATASLFFPDIYLWACNLSCWQSACD